MPENSGSWSWVDKMRGAFELIRDMLLALILGLLILSPGFVGGRLRAAGITEVSLPGITARLEEATKETEDANQKVVVLQQRLDQASDQIRSLHTLAANNPEMQQQINTLETNINTTRAQTKATGESLNHTLQVQRSIAIDLADRRAVR